MQDGLYVALSSQVALEKRLVTIADNVANANTVGFRATQVKFEDVVTGTGERSVSFASAGDTYMSTNQGPLKQTGNPYDFAVRGDAWFAIDTPAGQVMTRDGRFTMTEAGDLITLEGHRVLDAGGAPIQLNPRAGAPEASADGMLRQDGNPAGALGLFSFTPGVNLQRYGNSGIVPDGQPQAIVDRADVGIVQGYVEESNVEPVQEIMRLIQVQRAFDNISALMRDSESAIDDALRALGPTS